MKLLKIESCLANGHVIALSSVLHTIREMNDSKPSIFRAI